MLPTSFKELCSIFNEAHLLHVQFTKAIENDMTYAESNMMAVIVKMKIQAGIKEGQEETCIVSCDYSNYRNHNKSLESSTYYIKTSLTPNAFGTATEAGEYNAKDVLMIDASHDPNLYFIPVGNDLIKTFLDNREGKESYVQWLERLVIKSKIVGKLYGK